MCVFRKKQHFFSSIFVRLSSPTRFFSLIIFFDDDDGNSHQLTHMQTILCVSNFLFSFSAVLIIYMNEMLITGGLFDDAKEAEFVFKYAVRKTNEQMFNATMRRLSAGNFYF